MPLSTPLLALILSLHGAALGAQEPAPKPVPPPVEQPAPPKVAGEGAATPEPEAAPMLASDGKPLAPGRIPDDTSKEARESWERLLSATLGAGAARKPVSAFALAIDVQFKQTTSTINSLSGEYEYLAPGFVRVRFKESNNELVRGPDGDFLVDAKSRTASKLEGDRETKEDVRQLDDLISVARNFVALTDPKSLRLARLARLAAAPPVLGPGADGRALQWLEVESPDFRLARAARSSGATLYRVQIGLDAATALPRMVLVHAGAAKTPVSPTTLYLELTGWFEADGTKVPKQVKTFEVDPRTLAKGAQDPVEFRFQRDPTSDVFLNSARINPPLTADAFRPRKP